MSRNISSESHSRQTLLPYFTPLGACAFSISTAIGWGSFVVTCSTYLSQAGILGTVFGLLVGMAVILVINRNLIYMINRHQDAGGIYTYGRNVCGYDVGFLIFWFLLLSYLAVFWANITSLPLFARRFLGSAFQFGYCYTVFGYDVYLGELLLSIGVMALIGLLCTRSREVPQLLVILMTFIFLGVVVICSVVALMRHGRSGFSYEPVYLPDRTAFRQIMRIAVISPWAFIGFENIAHFSSEFNFPVKKVRGVLISSIVISTLFYILMALLSVTAYPPEYSNWLSYIRDMNNLEGIKGLPAFYAAYHYMGNTGVNIMMVALLSVVLTSIITNLTALSRLLYALGREHEEAAWFGKLNDSHIPVNAFIAVMAVSVLIPFLGRTAIGWIVDVTTIGATIIYAFLSFAVYRDAKANHDPLERVTGLTGVLIMVGFIILLLAPKLMSYETMAAESYLLFAVWSMLGLLLFRWILQKDRERKYGKSVIVWIMLLSLMLLTTMMWMNRSISNVINRSMADIDAFYQQYFEEGTYPEKEAEDFWKTQSDRIENAHFQRIYISYGLFVLSVLIMFNNFRTARDREEKYQQELTRVKQVSSTDSLTGVKNKHAYVQWENRINSDIDAGVCAPFALVVCDVNDLKRINDTMGHKAGDEVIREACMTVCKTFKHSPVFRIGGDEFVAILMGEDYASRQELVGSLTSWSEKRIRSRQYAIAIGIADYVEGKHMSMLEVFELADKAMYVHKRHLKDVWYRPDDD